jgi:hypothetical protein
MIVLVDGNKKEHAVDQKKIRQGFSYLFAEGKYRKECLGDRESGVSTYRVGTLKRKRRTT